MASFGKKFKQGAEIAAKQIVTHNKSTPGDTKKGAKGVYKDAKKIERKNKINDFFGKK